MLRIENLSVKYGQKEALKDIDLEINDGELVTLIGANGAGKTTLLRTISGLVNCSTGNLYFKGQSLKKLPPYKICSFGITQVPEGRRIFPELTVMENLRLGAFQRKGAKEVQSDLERVLVMFPRLKERLGQLGGTLSGGEQQMLAIARGLMAKPALLMLDEPSMGLAPILVAQIMEMIKNIHEQQGMTILLVEQNAKAALSIANRAYVLEVGRVVNHGDARQIARSNVVTEAYLGRGH